jgi:hypothetical protein
MRKATASPSAPDPRPMPCKICGGAIPKRKQNISVHHLYQWLMFFFLTQLNFKEQAEKNFGKMIWHYWVFS